MIDRVCKAAKDTKVLTGTTMGIITEKPCKVYAIYITPDYGTGVKCQIFNGTNENEEEKLEINASALATDYICPSLPLIFDKGIYIKSDDADAKFTFQIRELY